MRISVIVPALDEAPRIAAALAPALAQAAQCIVVDGGSRDGTEQAAASAGATRVLRTGRGRALQMNAGAHEADGEVLLFLHADTRLPAGWAEAVRRSLADGREWGRFDVELDSASPLVRLVGRAMNLRSRLTGICTGDQAIFVTRAAWDRAGGYPEIPLMEDIELSARLRRLAGRPACLPERVSVSARRWHARGPLRTILLMWALRAMHFLGVPPRRLHAIYYGRRG